MAGYLPKLKRGLELAFGAHFLRDFPVKMFFCLILYLWTMFHCHTFLPSQDIKQNKVLNSYLEN